MRPEDVVTTDTGRRMLRAVTPIYNDDEYQLSIFNANGLMMHQVLDAIEELKSGIFIKNATWSLPYWEQLFQIKLSDQETVEQRRRNIILKMNEFFPVTRRRMESIVDNFTDNGGTSIKDDYRDYTFEVFLNNPGVVDYVGLMNAVEETKPAHLDYTFKTATNMQSFIATAQLAGEETTIYPYSPEDIELTTSLTKASGLYTQEILEMKTKGV